MPHGNAHLASQKDRNKILESRLTERHRRRKLADLFGANRGPRPSVVSVDGLPPPTKMKTFWEIKYLNIYSTNK